MANASESIGSFKLIRHSPFVIRHSPFAIRQVPLATVCKLPLFNNNGLAI